MAVDYTKVFTVAGKYADKVRDYFLYVGTANVDQAAIETTLGAQSLVRLGDGLDEVYDGIRQSVSGWIRDLNSRVEQLFTDEILIGAEFAFGVAPSISQVWPVLIHDMVLGDKNVTASVATIGSPSYTVVNAMSGKAVTGNKLDGVTPCMDGAAVVPDYAGIVTQMTPDNETLTLICTQDSETGASRGAEQWSISGTGPTSDPYSSEGENIGSLGSISVADLEAEQYVTNPNFDVWSGSPESPDSWTVEVGTAGTDFVKESTNTLYGSGFALRTNGLQPTFRLEQVLSNTIFTRRKSYFVSVWARKVADVGDDENITITVRHAGGSLVVLNVSPSTTTYTHFAGQFLVPAEIIGNMEIEVECVGSGSADSVILDQIVITPCQYFAGVAVAIFGGPAKFLSGDKIEIALSNNNAGLFQNYFRKAFKVQLPTDATPTISDALVA